MAKKKRNRKSVLVTSCVLAALIVASSTFAWFSSKDEVTNRLTASANYGTAIAEDFTPPENLLPGQKVNKDVSVVNTGNIDALVKVHLEGAMNILKENETKDEQDVLATNFETNFAKYTDVTDPNLKNLGLTKKDEDGNYYRTLSTAERENDKHSSSTNDVKSSDGQAIEGTGAEQNHYSEVESVQAGGYLAYAGGAFKFIPETKGYTYTDTNGAVQVYTGDDYLLSNVIQNTWNGTKTTDVGLKIDSDTFLPLETGLYIFRRNVTEDVTKGSYYEYSGYYYVTSGSGDTGGQGTYYALHYLVSDSTTKYNSDFVIYSTKETEDSDGNKLVITYEDNTNQKQKSPVVEVAGTQVKLFSASYSRVDSVAGTYTNGASKTGTVAFEYKNSTDPDYIKVVANLVNIGESPEGWTKIDVTEGTTTTPYFYYNNDLEEGDSTAKLVDSVELDKTVKKTAYLALDFDLNVVLDSVQVTYNEAGVEQITAATETWSSELGTSTAATTASDGIEIASISWVEA